MYCKMCDIAQAQEEISIGHITVYLCKGCYEYIIDKYYEKMCEESVEKYGMENE